jgi:hypothetical protein
LDEGPTPSDTSDRPTPSDSQALSGDDLGRFDGDERFAAFVLERAGLRFVEDERQVWRIAGAELAVRCWHDDRGLYVLRVMAGWPEAPGPAALSMAETFAAAVTGELGRLPVPSLVRWKRRALVEAGLIPAPRQPSLRPLPDDAPERAARTWAAVRHLLAIRRLTEPPGTSFPFSVPWVAGWSGEPERVVLSGKRWLVRHGYLIHVGETPSRFGRPMHLYTAAGDE